MSEVPCDLHIHSYHSDGRFSPKRLVRILKSRGIKLASITDHDTMGGFLDFFECASQAGIKVISGIELSCWLDVGGIGEEVHILGYGLRWSQKLIDDLNELKRERDQHIKTMVNKLEELGFKFSFENLLRRAKKDPIMVSHLIWEYLIRHPSQGLFHLATGGLKKWVNNFLSITGPGGSAYIPPPLDVKRGIDFIRNHNGLVFLAHPWKIISQKMRESALALPLDGIEVFYPEQEKMEEELIRLAKERDLLISGGSDWHGYFGGAYKGWKLPLTYLNEFLRRLELEL